MKTHFVYVTWGQEMTRLLTEYSLPSLISSGNFLSWPWRKQAKIIFYATPESWGQTKYSKPFMVLKDKIDIEHIPITDNGSLSVHGHLTRIHSQAIAQAIKDGAGIFFLAPDAMFSKDTLKTIAGYIKQGKELVVIVGVRLRYQGVEDRIRTSFTSTQGVDMMLDIPHPMTIGQFWNSEPFTSMPTNLFYYRGEDTIICHGAHLHPFYVGNPVSFNPQSTIDGDYMHSFIDDHKKIKVVTNGSICCLSLTPDSHGGCFVGGQSYPSEEQRIQSVKRFVNGCHPVHRWFFKHSIQIKASKIDYPKMLKTFRMVSHIGYQSLVDIASEL